MRKAAWIMPPEEARTLLALIREKILSSHIDVRHRDALIRLNQLSAAQTTSYLNAMNDYHNGDLTAIY